MPLLAGLAIVAAFLALNYRAYDGYFQDDELDTLSWAPSRSMAEFASGLIKPTFDAANFRPPGHLYFLLMGRAWGLDFPPYITPVFAIHLLNAVLLLLLMRKLGIDVWQALFGVAFFALSASAMDAYWKPMYVFDLLCTAFSLGSILLFAYGRWILSFAAFWCAYKSKEVAVMLPVVLLAYEYWFGRRRYVVLLPFFAASLSFGLQGLLLNPNKHNEYTFHFTSRALKLTIPFYSKRFFLLPGAGAALFVTGLLRDRRIWLGLIGTACFLVLMLFLPGRLYEAYVYLPLACGAIALAAAACRVRPLWAWAALALWMPLNVRQLHREQSALLYRDDQAYEFVSSLYRSARSHPEITTLIYYAVPPGFQNWGVTAAWNIAHRTGGLRALFHDWPDATGVLAKETVVMGTLDPVSKRFVFEIHPPTYTQPVR